MKFGADRPNWHHLLLGIALLVMNAISVSCAQLTPLMGEGLPPGYIGGNIPNEYRGLVDPISASDERALETGRTLYQHNCSTCHGDNGRGDGQKADYLEPRPADFTTKDMLAAFRSHQDYVYWWVSEGVRQTSMPAFKDRLSAVERWQVISYAWHLAEQGNK